MATPVTNPVTHHNESVKRYAKVIGRSALRRAIFEEMYSYTKRPRSVEEIMDQTDFSAPKQSYRNELNKLAHGHVIDREDGNSSEVRTLYARIPEVMAKKAEILALVDNPTKAKKLPTSQEPRVSVHVKSGPSIKRSKTIRNSLRILYVTATPSSQAPLRVEAEYRMVTEQVRRSDLRDRIAVDLRPAADLQSILQGINDCRPQIVHFSGHADRSGLWLDDGKVVGSTGSELTYRRLAETLDSTDTPPRVVILNACETDAAAAKLIGIVEAVVTMSRSVTDLGAANFASQLYSALGAGQSVESAFKQAKVLMEQISSSDVGNATLTIRGGVNGKKLKLM